MKATTVVKVIPIVHMTSPILLQCKDGECGGCPSNTGKMLWVPRDTSPYGGPDLNVYKTFNFQYNFFDKAAESVASIKYNYIESNTLFGDKPTKAIVTATTAQDFYPTFSPSLMRSGNTLQFTPSFYNYSSMGQWIFFRQPNPAIANVHDALCFEYNNDKRLITFRSF